MLHKRWGTLRTRAKKALGKPDATYTEIINCLKKEQDDIPRAEVKAFMAKKPDEVDGADEDGDGEEEDGDGDEEEISESTPVAGGSGNTPAVVQPSATRTTAQGEGRRRKTQDQSQFRTSEFVHSSDEED